MEKNNDVGFNTITMSELGKTTLYHVSDKEYPTLRLTPRVPNNYFTRMGAEDDTTNRISFSSTVEGALIALSKNLQGKILHVYRLEDYKGEIVPNSEINKLKLVPDAKVTNEHWLLGPAVVKYAFSIKVYEANSHPFRYTYNLNGKTKEGRVYGWTYRKLQEKERSVGDRLRNKVKKIRISK